MEVIDVGTKSVDEVIDLLFQGDNLHSLIGWHGVACFVLVRQITAPDFYRRLIENSDSIDATTRKHIAFIVFHGDRSGVVHEARNEYSPYLARERIDGLSVNGDGYFGRKSIGEPPVNPPAFAKGVAQQLRYAPDQVDLPMLSRHMGRAATRLMERFGLRESALPCLLFVDGNDPTRNSVVSLDPIEPLRSLYENVLLPLSDELGDLSSFWELRDSLKWERERRQRAETALEHLPSSIEALDQLILTKTDEATAELSKRDSVIEHLNRVSASLNSCDPNDPAISDALSALPQELQAQQRKFCHAHSLTLPVMRTTAEQESKMRAYMSGEGEFKSEGHRDLILTKLGRQIQKNRDSIQGRMRDLQRQVKAQVASIEHEKDAIRSELAGLRGERERRQLDLRDSQEHLEQQSAAQLAIRESKVNERELLLRKKGYDDRILLERTPSAFSVVQLLVGQSLLGTRRQSTTHGKKSMMRILFMAANPTTTTALDLEEELRNLELELGRARYRDQITLVARHAVRPDDLVRHVRAEHPTVIHFSGHGSDNGIVLRSDDGGYTEVSGLSLRRFLEERGVELLVLNACFSGAQANLASSAVKAVVGTTSAVGDEAARRFSTAFYRALGEGLSVREAFRDGGDAVALHNLQDVFWSDGDLDYIPIESS